MFMSDFLCLSFVCRALLGVLFSFVSISKLVILGILECRSYLILVLLTVSSLTCAMSLTIS